MFTAASSGEGKACTVDMGDMCSGWFAGDNSRSTNTLPRATQSPFGFFRNPAIASSRSRSAVSEAAYYTTGLISRRHAARGVVVVPSDRRELVRACSVCARFVCFIISWSICSRYIYSSLSGG